MAAGQRRPVGAELGGRAPSRWRSSSTTPPAMCRKAWSARWPRTCCSTCAAPCSRTCSASRCRFMDKTEVGRLMSRLQGDVNSMQEFLETSVHVGRRHRAALRHRQRAAVARLPARPADAVDDAGAVHRAPVLAAAAPRSPSWRRTRPTRSPTARWPKASTACARCRAWTASRSISTLYDDKALANLERAPDRGAATRRSWCRSSTR